MKQSGLVKYSNLVLGIACAAILIWVAVRAVMDPLVCWDPWHYHVAFMIALWDIEGGRAIPGVLSSRYYGFGLVGEWLQGLLWVLTDTINTTSLVNMLPFLAVIFYARRWFGIPLPFMVFAMLAMPMITIHLTSAYIDLMAGGFLALEIIAAIRLLVLCQGESTRRQRAEAAIVLLLAATLSANTKFNQLAGALVVLVFTFYRLIGKKLLFDLFFSGGAFIVLMGTAYQYHATPAELRELIYAFIGIHLVLVLLSLCRRNLPHRWVLLIVFLSAFGASATSIKNLVQHDNPFFPFDVRVFPGEPLYIGHEGGYLSRPDDPVWWRPIYFVLSVTEIDWLLHPPRHYLYSEAGQAGDWRWKHGTNGRIGGLFGPLVILLVGFSIWGTRRLRRRGLTTPEIRVGWQYFLVMTGVGFVVMQSHELRYMLAWPITLCTLAGMIFSTLFKKGTVQHTAIQWGLVLIFLGTQFFLPLQRTLFSLSYVDYRPEALKANLDPATLNDFRTYGKACLEEAPIPYNYDGFATCPPARWWVYSAPFTKEHNGFQWLYTEEECAEFKKFKAAAEAKERKAD